MKFWFWRDASGWGRALLAAAHGRGHAARLFDEPEHVDRGHVFVRLCDVPGRGPLSKATIKALLANPDVVTLPDARMARLYDDKVEQAVEFGRWLPTTFVVWSREDARKALRDLTYPFLSKSRQGSASNNVRLVENVDDAEREIALAFDGFGIPIHYGERQKGYLLWQEFLAGNRYDYRVTRVGTETAIVRRWNRESIPFASGGGRIEFVDRHEPEVASALEFAEAFLVAEGISFAAIDVMRGPNGWRLIETSSAWPVVGPNWSQRKFISGRSCADLWDVMIEQWERGVFG